MATTRKTRERRKKRIPSLKEIEEYAKEFNHLDFTPDYFCDFYERTHWRIAGYKIHDWRAVFRVWVRNSRSNPQNATQRRQQQIAEERERVQQEFETRYQEAAQTRVSYEEYQRMKREGRV